MENQGQSPSIEAELRHIGFIERASKTANQGFIRLVQWNIEKGKRWDLLERCLQAPAICSADILCLNEADYGMARSGNRHVAFEIAERLEMSVVFGPAYVEFTKGIGDELYSPGDNSYGVQGNALLTRLPVMDYRNLTLPQCFDASQGLEKRAGGRCGLAVRVGTRDFSFIVAVPHLEVLTTRRCREMQVRALLEGLGDKDPVIIAGDLNTNTFDRGSRLSTIQSLVTLLGPNVKKRVSRPWESEPLFEQFRSRAFSWEPFNDGEATNVVDLSSLEDRKYIPGFVVQRALKRGRHLPLRLDWIVCRGFQAVGACRTITDLPCRPSDHLPITCDLAPAS